MGQGRVHGYPLCKPASGSFAMHLCDVPGDGDCFYTSIVRCLCNSPEILGLPSCETEAVDGLRALVADEICSTAPHGCLRSLVVLCKKDRTLKDEFPLLKGAASLEAVAANITEKRVWASEIEVEASRSLLRPFGTALVVLQDGADSAADQLLAAVDKIELGKCILLVRVNDNHYQYLAEATQTVFNTAWLIYKASILVMTEDEDDQLF